MRIHATSIGWLGHYKPPQKVGQRLFISTVLTPGQPSVPSQDLLYSYVLWTYKWQQGSIGSPTKSGPTENSSGLILHVFSGISPTLGLSLKYACIRLMPQKKCWEVFGSNLISSTTILEPHSASTIWGVTTLAHLAGILKGCLGIM